MQGSKGADASQQQDEFVTRWMAAHDAMVRELMREFGRRWPFLFDQEKQAETQAALRKMGSSMGAMSPDSNQVFFEDTSTQFCYGLLTLTSGMHTPGFYRSEQWANVRTAVASRLAAYVSRMAASMGMPGLFKDVGRNDAEIAAEDLSKIDSLVTQCIERFNGSDPYPLTPLLQFVAQRTALDRSEGLTSPAQIDRELTPIAKKLMEVGMSMMGWVPPQP